VEWVCPSNCAYDRFPCTSTTPIITNAEKT
jgi:hypothetical protein